MGCRLITVRLKASPFNINIQAYAPTSDYDDDDIEDFCDQLQEVIDQAPKKDIVTLHTLSRGEDSHKACNLLELAISYCGF